MRHAAFFYRHTSAGGSALFTVARERLSMKLRHSPSLPLFLIFSFSLSPSPSESLFLPPPPPPSPLIEYEAGA